MSLAIAVTAACAPQTPLPSFVAEPGASPAGVLVTGTLQVSAASGCVELKPTGYPPIALEWPAGYTVDLDPVKVYGPTGAEVASQGAEITLGGSLIRVPNVRCGTESTLRVIGVSTTELAP